MNNKGFAISGILYSILVIFVVLIAMTLFNLQNRKTILDELKAEAVQAVEEDNNFEYLYDKINSLEERISTLEQPEERIDISSTYNMTVPDGYTVREKKVYKQGKKIELHLQINKSGSTFPKDRIYNFVKFPSNYLRSVYSPTYEYITLTAATTIDSFVNRNANCYITKNAINLENQFYDDVKEVYIDYSYYID